MSSLVSLPEDAIRNISTFLPGYDILNLLSSHRRLHYDLGGSECFWKMLLLSRQEYQHQQQIIGSTNYTSSIDDSGTRYCSTQEQQPPEKKKHPIVLKYDTDTDDNDSNSNWSQSIKQQQQQQNAKLEQNVIKKAKEEFLIQEYCTYLPSVKWIPIQENEYNNHNYNNSRRWWRNENVFCPTPREGHNSCKLGTKLIITGGFGEDNTIYCLETSASSTIAKKNATTATTTTSGSSDRTSSNASWVCISPQVIVTSASSSSPASSPESNVSSLARVYGASLTPIDDTHAVRFGGFCAGGYSFETSQIALLTLHNNNSSKKKRTNLSEQQQSASNLHNLNEEEEIVVQVEKETIEATWEIIQPTNQPPFGCAVARAYHTATLVNDRYLVIIGGMTSLAGSILDELILDIKTWKWMNCNDAAHSIQFSSKMEKQLKPTGRHGHSVILDPIRNRLVLFGGGSGSDLLRSGFDNAQVWELRMGEGFDNNNRQQFQRKETHGINSIDDDDDLKQSSSVIVWEWNRLIPRSEPRSIPKAGEQWNNSSQADFSNNNDDAKDENENQNSIMQTEQTILDSSSSRSTQTTSLSPSQALTLGRCHIGLKVAPNTALFMFGSGRPSTNGILAFNLQEDKFFPVGGIEQKISGPLPCPRFTAVAAFLDNANSFIFAHGGYSSQENRAISDPFILDLAPALKRPCPIILPVRENAISYQRITDGQAVQERFGRGRRGDILEAVLLPFLNANQNDRLAYASRVFGGMFGIQQREDDSDFDDE